VYRAGWYGSEGQYIHARFSLKELLKKKKKRENKKGKD
jgi:hypothetical protein